MKLLSKTPFYFQKYTVWIFLILTIPTFSSLLRPGFYTMHDDLQAFRVHQLDKCIQDLQIPCRWVPDMGYGYGYPQFNYYPPSVYYLAEVFHLVGFQFIDTIKIIVILGLTLSALFMYLFLKEWIGKLPGFVGGMLYAYAPYKAVDVYVRGAFSEFFALVIFPLLFWSSYRLIKNSNLKNFAFFAISVSLLLLTHNLMSLIFFPVLGIWILTWIILERKWKLIIKFLLGGLLGIGLAAFFTLPVAFERKYAHIESIIGGYFDYRLHFANLNQIFISNFFDYGSSVWGPDDDISMSTGQIHWTLGFFSVFLALYSFKKYPKLSALTFVLSGITLFSLFLIHQKSSFIWSQIKFLEYLQFPWRFLANTVFLLSILSAVMLFFLGKISFKTLKNVDVIVGGFIIVLAFFLYGNFFKPHTWLNITDEDKFTGESWEKQLTVSIFDYLPIYAKLPPVKKAPDLPEVLEGDVKFNEYKKGSNFQKGELEVSKESLIRLPLFNFPGMQVISNGEVISHWHDDCRNQEFCLGLITFKLEPGRYSVEARLTDTPVRTIGNSLTLFSFVVLLMLAFRKGKYEKKS